MNLIRSITFWRKKESPKPRKLSLVLHIGIEKTGTTTIQEFLHLNRKLLLLQGIAFPKSPSPRNHRNLALAICSGDDPTILKRHPSLINPDTRNEWKKETITNFLNEIISLPNHIKSVILSSEHFSSVLKDQSGIILFKEFLKKYFFAIKIIVYLRRQDQTAISRMSTALKGGAKTDVLTGNIFNHVHFYDYHKLLEKWGEAFPEAEIVPRIFESSEFIEHDLLSDFMHCAGIIKNESFVIPGNQNTSLSATSQELAKLLNQKLGTFIGNTNDPGLKRKTRIFIQNISHEFPGQGFQPSRAEAQKFYNKYEVSNQEVARKWFNRNRLFSENFSMYPESAFEPKPDSDLLDAIFARFEALISDSSTL